MKAVVQVADATDVGKVRDHNEDTVFARAFGPGHPWGLTALLLVADGVGGRDAGEVASRIAGETLWRWFGEGGAAVLGGTTPSALAAALLGAIQEANHQVCLAGEGAASTPASTLTVCLVRPGEVFVGHVGDSRAYLLSAQGARQLTDDDSMVADAVRRGQMTEEEARTSPYRNQILKALGVAPTVEPAVHQFSLRSGDALLVCSDGLSEYVGGDELRDVAFRAALPEDACRDLIALANARGGHDNVSVALLRGGAVPRLAPRPATRERPALAGVRPRDPNLVPRYVLLSIGAALAIVLGTFLAHRYKEWTTAMPSPSPIPAPRLKTYPPTPVPPRPKLKVTQIKNPVSSPKPLAPTPQSSFVENPTTEPRFLRFQWSSDKKTLIIRLEGDGELVASSKADRVDAKTIQITNILKSERKKIKFSQFGGRRGETFDISISSHETEVSPEESYILKIGKQGYNLRVQDNVSLESPAPESTPEGDNNQ